VAEAPHCNWLEAPCILVIDHLRRGYVQDTKGYWWAFSIAALETEEIKQLSILPGLSEDPSVVGLLRMKNNRCQSLQQRRTSDNIALTETPLCPFIG